MADPPFVPLCPGDISTRTANLGTNSVGCISWILCAELFPTAVRAKGTSLSTFTNWASNLVVAQCSPIALSRMGYRYFYIFMAFNWTAAAVVYLYYPETQGYTLEKVNEIFDDIYLGPSNSYPDGDVTTTKPTEKVHPAKEAIGTVSGLSSTEGADGIRCAES